jgi:DNA-binding transcriptional MerR regulator
METQVTPPVRFFSPAETSRRLGVSVRALRFYERRGLVRPQRTEAGWRVYGPAEIARLHQILALKSLGLSLTRIAELIKGRETDLDAVLALQEQVLTTRQADLERALAALRKARARLAADQTLSLDDLATLSKETAMRNPLIDDETWARDFAPLWRRHLTDAGYEKFFRVEPEALAALGMDEAQFRAAWKTVIEETERLCAAGDPRAPEARAAVERWMQLQEVYLKGDPELMTASVLAQYETLSTPHLAEKMNVSRELLTFVNEVIVLQGLGGASPFGGAPSGGVPDPRTEKVVRRAVASLQAGEPKYERMTPELAAIARPQTPMFQDLIQRLGPLRDVAFAGVSEAGDTYRVTFEEAALNCAVRLNADGLIESLSWVAAGA